MQERFEGRAIVEWDVAQDVLDTPVPSMLLQPLLENAFKHGVERNVEPVQISIRAARVGHELRVEIHNSGSSMPVASTGAMEPQRDARCASRLMAGWVCKIATSDSDCSTVRPHGSPSSTHRAVE